MMNTMQHIIFLFGLLLLANHCDAYTISHCALNPRIRLLAKQPTRTASLTMASSVLHSTTSESQNDNNEKKVQPLRGKLRKITGFSLTAFRSSWRAATGISLTALYASAVAASGLWIRTTMSKILSIIPDWVRCLLHHFCVLLEKIKIQLLLWFCSLTDPFHSAPRKLNITPSFIFLAPCTAHRRHDILFSHSWFCIMHPYLS